MKREKIIIANWKMEVTIPEGRILISALKEKMNKPKIKVAVCPTLIDIYPVIEELGDSEIEVGAQNVSLEECGAFTGEVSILSLKGFAKYVIVGHSERRRHFGENDKIVAQKAAIVVRHGLVPVICVGETLHEKEDGLSKVVTLSQVEAACKDLTKEEIAKSVIAYEPVWAIGTGHECTKKEAQFIIKEIRGLIKALYGEETAESVRILYGGSVNKRDAGDFASAREIDGVLVGKASLNPEEFTAITAAFEK